MALIAANISFGRRGHTVLHNASLQCGPGEFVAVCGPNGAGKSTLLKVLAGDIQPLQGTVSVGGFPLAAMDHAQRARYRAVMQQQHTMAFAFAAREVVAMGLWLTPHSSEREAIVEQVLNMLELHDLAHKPYPQLSGGEQQRVQLARVMAQLLQKNCSPRRYLLLDECSSAMDMAVVHKVFRLLRQQCCDQLGIVAIVHDLNLASLYADRMVLMQNHTTVHSGTPEELMRADIIDRVFGTAVQVVGHPLHGKPMLLAG